jgi:hypothetical protein
MGITCGLEEVCAFGWLIEIADIADGTPEFVDGPIAMKLSRQNVEIPATTRASPSVEFIMLQGHSGHDRNFLSALHPAIGARIRCRKALIYPCWLHADARLYGLGLRLQFRRLFYLTVEELPVLQHSLRDFAVGIRHAQVS